MTQLRKVIAPVASGSAQSTMSCTRLTQANWCQSAESNSNLTRSTCTGGHPFPVHSSNACITFSAEEIKVLQSHIKDGESVTCAALVATNAVLSGRSAGSVRNKLRALRKADSHSIVALAAHATFSAEEIKVLQSHIKDGESVTCAALIAQNAVLSGRNAGSVRKKLGALRKADPSTVSLPSHPSHYVCPPHTQ